MGLQLHMNITETLRYPRGYGMCLILNFFPLITSGKLVEAP